MGFAQLTSARTIVFFAGALLCLGVAAWPLVASRRAAGAGRFYSWRLSVVALFTAAAFVVVSFQPAPRRAPVQPLVALPAAAAIGPGAAIAVTYADGGMACTAGFLVRKASGQTGVLTAGHCNKTGEASKVIMNAGSVPYQTVGTFGPTISEGERGEAHDIGLIWLDSEEVPHIPAIAATSTPVSGVAGELRIGQQLCKFGMKTGRTECGQITDVTESKVVFLAASQCGDSGGPVYLLDDDRAAAVGIHIRGGRPNDPHPGCSVPATFSVAELVRPWLDQWGLSVVTG
ncbi:S1 family peptidase [Mycobacterium asiaticum]|uniref:S1 family peptidase n=1 Tax=Mycobacterium asiaticum TaxID=1790 RepID=UPI000AD087D0|nr:S1 family peptidase [Mycobacterium asiaticum]